MNGELSFAQTDEMASLLVFTHVNMLWHGIAGTTATDRRRRHIEYLARLKCAHKTLEFKTNTNSFVCQL